MSGIAAIRKPAMKVCLGPGVEGLCERVAPRRGRPRLGTSQSRCRRRPARRRRVHVWGRGRQREERCTARRAPLCDAPDGVGRQLIPEHDGSRRHARTPVGPSPAANHVTMDGAIDHRGGSSPASPPIHPHMAGGGCRGGGPSRRTWCGAWGRARVRAPRQGAPFCERPWPVLPGAADRRHRCQRRDNPVTKVLSVWLHPRYDTGNVPSRQLQPALDLPNERQDRVGLGMRWVCGPSGLIREPTALADGDARRLAPCPQAPACRVLVPPSAPLNQGAEG
jgi:hypothetical protein